MGLAIMSNACNVIILGAQWGDEGKGKVVDLFSERFDVVARYQGGHNAGHTVRIGDRKFVLKLIPSGILRPGKKAVIGNGLVVDPAALLDEIQMLEAAGLQVEGNLFISNRAQVLLPTHRLMEKLGEARPGRVSIGTTSRGIGPCYEDKIASRGSTRWWRNTRRPRGLWASTTGWTPAASAPNTKGWRSASAPWSATPPGCCTMPSPPASAWCSKARRAPCWISIMAPIRS